MKKKGLKSLGASIKRYRKGRGLDQAEFASIVRISRSYVSSIEQGTRNPSLKVLERIAKALNVPLKELF